MPEDISRWLEREVVVQAMGTPTCLLSLLCISKNETEPVLPGGPVLRLPHLRQSGESKFLPVITED